MLFILNGTAVAQLIKVNTSDVAKNPEYFEVVAVDFRGLERTNREWLESYINIELPAKLTREDAKLLQNRLLTTAVFSQVRVLFTPISSRQEVQKYMMQIDVVERWTTIPVIRGVYGGGTPLRVLGLYDIHVLGRLLTIGGEGQKYGNAPIGSVLYAKSPRHDAGKYFIGGEFWQEYRQRIIYQGGHSTNDVINQIGTLETSVKLARFSYLQPLIDQKQKISSYAWRVGGELTWFREDPSNFTSKFDETDSARHDLGYGAGSRETLRALPAITYDNINLNIIHLDGLRLATKLGPTLYRSEKNDLQWHSFFEVETFWYKLWTQNLNFAAHHVIGRSSKKSVRNQYFLGGLDSIRGFVDGAVFGTHATWLNLELRHLSWQPSQYSWVQSVLFCDSGSAASNWSLLSKYVLTACGIGARIAIPQVNRLIFRFDYARDLIYPHRGGFTIGMNQFFDPYKPLSDR